MIKLPADIHSCAMLNQISYKVHSYVHMNCERERETERPRDRERYRDRERQTESVQLVKIPTNTLRKVAF